MPDCPKCRNQMTQGFLYLPDTDSRVSWLDGAPGFQAIIVIWASTTANSRLLAGKRHAHNRPSPVAGKGTVATAC